MEHISGKLGDRVETVENMARLDQWPRLSTTPAGIRRKVCDHMQGIVDAVNERGVKHRDLAGRNFMMIVPASVHDSKNCYIGGRYDCHLVLLDFGEALFSQDGDMEWIDECAGVNPF